MRPVRSVPLPPNCDPESVVLTFAVAPEYAGLRLDRFIQNRIPRLSRTRAQEIVRACAYRPDGERRRASERVRAGEVVMLVRPRLIEPETPRTFEVLHDDADLLAIDKPAGLPMHPTATYHRNTLTYLLRERYGDPPPHIAHRLDRETSGIVLCGRHLEAERELKRCFEERRVDKTYLAIVEGEMNNDVGFVDLPLAPAREGLHVLMEVRDANDEGALEARTRYEVERRTGGRTLVRLTPTTGRQHQLRVHLAAIGHPIVGDKLYGRQGVGPFLEYIETGMTPALERRLGLGRQALHAASVTFPHPGTGEEITVHAPMPDDMLDLWADRAPEI